MDFFVWPIRPLIFANLHCLLKHRVKRNTTAVNIIVESTQLISCSLNTDCVNYHCSSGRSPYCRTTILDGHCDCLGKTIKAQNNKRCRFAHLYIMLYLQICQYVQFQTYQKAREQCNPQRALKLHFNGFLPQLTFFLLIF